MEAGWGKLKVVIGQGSALYSLHKTLSRPCKLNRSSRGVSLMTICFYSEYSLGGEGISPHTLCSLSQLFPSDHRQACSLRGELQNTFFLPYVKGLGWCGHLVMSDHSYGHFLPVLALIRGRPVLHRALWGTFLQNLNYFISVLVCKTDSIYSSHRWENWAWEVKIGKLKSYRL